MNLEHPSLGCEFFNQLPYRYLDTTELDGVDALLELDVTDAIRGPNGGVHAGVTSVLADVAGSMAIAVRTERGGASQSVSLNCVAMARVGPLRASATMLRASRHSAVAEVKVIDCGNDDRLVAAALITCALFADAGGDANPAATTRRPR